MNAKLDFFILPKAAVLEKEIGNPFDVYCFLASCLLHDPQKGHGYSDLESLLHAAPFSVQQFNTSAFRRFLATNFEIIRGGYALTEAATAKLNQALSVIYYFGVYRYRETDGIKLLLVKGIKNNSLSFPDALTLTLALRFRQDIKTEIFWDSLSFSSIKNLSLHCSSLNDSLQTIEKEHPDISLSAFLPKFEINILSGAGILTFGDLRRLNSLVLLAVFAGDEDKLIGIIKGICDIRGELSGDYEKLFSPLTPEEKDVLQRRMGGGLSGCKETLERISLDYGVTRERIRQIQNKSVRKVCRFLPPFLTKLKVAYVLASEPGCDFVSFERLDEKLNLPGFSHRVSLLSEMFPRTFAKSEIALSSDYLYFCDNGPDGVNEINNRILSTLGSVISDADYAGLGSVEKRIADRLYYHRGTSLLRRGHTSGEFMLDIVESFFPQGINPASPEQFDLFSKIWVNQYGMPVIRSSRLRNAIERDKERFVAKDKGVWISSDSVSDLSDDQFFRISRYISETGTPIFYATLFDHFKDELVNSGIPNRYRLKSLFDRRDSVFVHKRDYLSGSHNENTEKMIIAFADKQSGIVSLESLQQRFPGTAYSSFMYSLGNNGYLLLTGGRFLNCRKANLSSRDITELHDCIRELVNASPTNVVSQSRIYSMLCLWHSSWLSAHPYVVTAFDLSSLITHLFPNEFQCFRHMVFLAGDDMAKAYEMLIGFCSKQPVVTVKMIQNFYAKTGLIQNRTFLTIFSDLAETYLQLWPDRMVAIPSFPIGDEKKDEVNQALGMIMDSIGCIDTRYFQSYSILPACGFAWTCFSLFGFVRSFLGTKYSVEILDGDYRTLQFILRRIEHE